MDKGEQALKLLREIYFELDTLITLPELADKCNAILPRIQTVVSMPEDAGNQGSESQKKLLDEIAEAATHIENNKRLALIDLQGDAYEVKEYLDNMGPWLADIPRLIAELRGTK